MVVDGWQAGALDFDADALDFAKGGGLVTVVTQDADTGAVLMVAHADREAIARCIETGEMHYTSRTRGLWHKGATSGNRQQVVRLSADCDGDAVLASVKPLGPACHTGQATCFGETPSASTSELHSLDTRIQERQMATTGAEVPASYTRRLLGDRNLRLKKLGEEAAEFAVACADEERERAIEEAADLFYHVLVALRALGAGVVEVEQELSERRR